MKQGDCFHCAKGTLPLAEPWSHCPNCLSVSHCRKRADAHIGLNLQGQCFLQVACLEDILPIVRWTWPPQNRGTSASTVMLLTTNIAPVRMLSTSQFA